MDSQSKIKWKTPHKKQNMFRNQYYITNYKTSTDLDFQSKTFGDFYIYYSPVLPGSYAKSESAAVLALGYLIDPFRPEHDNQDICSMLASCIDEREFMYKAQGLSGRYVILYKVHDYTIAISDALGHRQIYYNNDRERIFLTSSPKLFLYVVNTAPCINEKKLKLIQSKQFKYNQNAWFGSESIDDRLNKVLPNHFINLKTMCVYRKLFKSVPRKSETEVRKLCGEILKGGIAGAVRRYRLMEPITAGFDSRALLAASKEYKNDIFYYTFQRPEMPPHYSDLEVPCKLTKRLGVNYRVLRTEPLRDDFLDAYKSEHIVPRILSKTQNIQYHYYNSRRQGNILDVKGSGGGMLRLVFGRTPSAEHHEISAEMLVYFSGYAGNEYVSEQIRKWLIGAKEFGRTHDIALQDLFYWEQRMGNWGADHGLEQDIAIEEFWPFNNALLLLSGLGLDENKKAWPKYAFFVELIRDLWPEVLAEPINPKKNIVRKYVGGYVKSDSYRRYCAMKLNELTHNRLRIKVFRF